MALDAGQQPRIGGRWPQHDFTSLKKTRPQSVTSRIQPGSDVIVCARKWTNRGYVGLNRASAGCFTRMTGSGRRLLRTVFGERTMATLGRLYEPAVTFDVVIWMTDGGRCMNPA